MLRVKEIEIEGFASIVKPLTFVFDLGPTLSVIRGNVGAGKTTIPSALCWALYGRTLKEKSTIETWQSIRPETYRGVKVVVTFEKGKDVYQVIKCKNFKGKITIGKNQKVKGGNNVFILLNGEVITGDDTKGLTATHNYIQKTIGYSFDLFKNSVIFGQKMKRIIEETGPNKKKVFDEAFEMTFIDEAKKNEEAHRNKLNNTYSELKIELDKVSDKLEDKEDSYREAIENETTFQITKQQRLKDIDSQVKVLNRDIEELKSEISEIGKLKTKQGLEKSISKLESDIKSIEINNDKYTELKEAIEDNESDIVKHEKTLSKKPKLCPTCSLPLSDKGYNNMVASAKAAIKILKEDISSYKKELKTLKPFKNTSELKLELTELKNQQSNYNLNLLRVNKATTKLEELNKRINQLVEKAEAVKKEKLNIKSTKYKEAIKELKKKKKKINSKIESVKDAIVVKDWLINDPLSNNGLKAYLFDELLNQVNARLDEYAIILGFQVEFGIDLESHRKDFYQLIMKDNEVVPYEDLSGGQKQLVDTAVALAIHTVIADIRPTNFLFMDEPFESLGVEEVEVVAELIQEKAKEASVFLITHHTMFNPVNVNEIYVGLDENKHTYIS